ncbi:MAG TPA: LamG domain-containing protein [Planctomycetota bacterium]
MGILILITLAQERGALDLFKQRVAAAKTVHEKAAAIRELGHAREPGAVPALARYLAPQPSDCNCLLPVAAAEALGKLRGSVGASRALAGAAEASRKNAYLYARYVDALARVGHESGLALFEDALKGPEAAAAVKAIAAFPPGVAVEALLVEARKAERKGGEGVDRLREELLKGLQKVSGEKYPTFAEFELWWKKRGPSFRVEAEAREKASPPPGPSSASTLLVELAFRENGGTSTANSGASAAFYPSCALGNAAPAWTGRVPVNGGPSALEWPKEGGAPAVELGAGESLRALKSFTLSGWMLRTEAKEEGGAGQRILTWLGPSKAGEGVELTARADGRLQIGINQPAEASTLATPPGLIPVLDPKSKEPNDAWRFFAVTYDSTAAADQVKFYVGGWNADAKLVGASTSARGPAGTKIAPTLAIGGPSRAGGARAFRGALDEIRIHGSALDGSGALDLPALIRTQNRETP